MYYLDKCNGDCSKNVLEDLDKYSNINNCYFDSFEVSNQRDKNKKNFDLIYNNKILESDYKGRRKFMIYKNPSMRINGRLYLDDLESNLIFDYLCASLIQKTKKML